MECNPSKNFWFNGKYVCHGCGQEVRWFPYKMGWQHWKERGIDMKDRPPVEEVPADARHAARGLERWIDARRARNVPEEGFHPAELFCPESCTLHDHER